MKMLNIKYILGSLLFSVLGISNVLAGEKIVNLTVAYKTVHYAPGKTHQAIAVNDQIPGPTLHFKEGDTVTINVYNRLNKGTSIHWHGIILPWQMDGVEGVTQKAIPSGGVFHYWFTLNQSGTYWYHAHADVQEQEGLYGALIIDPTHSAAYHYNRDNVIVLSDWSNTSAHQVFANLKEGDYYSPLFPLQPSLMKFIHDYQSSTPTERKQLVSDYKMMQQMRMSIYDLSDVAYDAYLLNGKNSANPWTSLVKVGDVIRLRFIGAAGSTIYRVKIPGSTMQMVHIQGNDVKPYIVDDFSIAPGETVDVLVNIEKNKPYIIYAESIDTRGVAVGALVTEPFQKVNYQSVPPFPEPLPVTRGMNHGSMSMPSAESHTGAMKMSSKDMHMHESTSPTMDHSMSINHTMDMNMPTEPSRVGDTISPSNSSSATTSGTKYQNLMAAVKTNDPDKPIKGIINMELFGYMDHFIWFINGLPEYKAKPIIIEPGKRYRIIFTNNSMMRHPMHIHGHWFILRNGHGAYDPLLHTIEVPPGATAVADIDMDASGQWFFHCHHIYHMLAGMARVFQYDTILDVANGVMQPEKTISLESYVNRPIVRMDEQLPDTALISHPMAHKPGLYRATFLDVGEDPFNNVQKVTFKTLIGPDYNKLEFYTEDAEMKQGTVENADIDIFYWHLLSQFWAIKGGANYYNQPAQTPYWQPGIGVEGLMPYFIETNIRGYYHKSSGKIDVQLSRDTQLTNNFFVRIGIRSILATKTVDSGEVGSGLNQMRYIVRPYYRISPGLSVFFEYEHESDYGDFADFLRNNGESTGQDTYTFGFSILI